jgi:exosortase B
VDTNTAVNGSPAFGRDQASAGEDKLVAGLLALGLVLAYGPTYWDLLIGRWASSAQGHEGFVAAISGWLLYRKRHAVAALPSRGSMGAALGLLVTGMVLYVFGRSQQFLRIELISQFFVIAALLVGYRGWRALRLAWFPLAFLLFVIPLPYALIMTLTGPLKSGVSALTTELLAWAGYPIGRSGVVITIGQYELLVATACAGLQTMFTLEALGLLYLHLRNYESALRNALLALLIIPVSFCANVIRVAVLALVTYHFGDAAGQGFFHGFAGMLLFGTALVLIMLLDRAVVALLPARYRV